MNDVGLITTYSLLTEYRKNYSAILKQLKPAIQKAKAESEASGEVVHNVITLCYDEKQYICSVYHSSFHEQCTVYSLVPRKNSFEAFGYDKETRRYYLYHDHFFKGYSERLNMGHKSPPEILKHYFLHNPLMLFSRFVEKKGKTQSLTAVVRTGVLHGYVVHPYRIVNFRTLISHYILTKQEAVYTGRLRRVLRNMELCK